MSDLTITIPGLVLSLLIVSVAWMILGTIFNNLVLKRIKRSVMKKRRTSVVPKWVEPTAYAIAGPIGWILFIWDEPIYKLRRKWRKSRQRRSQEKRFAQMETIAQEKHIGVDIAG